VCAGVSMCDTHTQNNHNNSTIIKEMENGLGKCEMNRKHRDVDVKK